MTDHHENCGCGLCDRDRSGAFAPPSVEPVTVKLGDREAHGFAMRDPRGRLTVEVDQDEAAELLRR